MKICCECSGEKPLSDFHKNASRKDGIQSVCKSCKAKIGKEYASGYFQKKYYSDENFRTATKARANAFQKTEKGRAWFRKYAKNNPKHRARTTLNMAIKRGKITRMPCLVCGKLPSEAHHKDYSKPLEIVWLCKNHHTQIHNRKKENEPIYL